VRVVHHLEQAVAQHEIGLAERGDLGEPLDLAGHGRDQLLDPGVASPAAQGGERVGAGVDDRDRASRRGQRHGPRPAAAADVQHRGSALGRAVADRGELGGHRAVHRAADTARAARPQVAHVGARHRSHLAVRRAAATAEA